jgi:hypothetical protein
MVCVSTHHDVRKMTKSPKTRFSKRIPVFKGCISVLVPLYTVCNQKMVQMEVIMLSNIYHHSKWQHWLSHVMNMHGHQVRTCDKRQIKMYVVSVE